MVHRIIAASVLQRLDTAADNVLWFATPHRSYAHGIDCRVDLLCVGLEAMGSITNPKAGNGKGVARVEMGNSRSALTTFLGRPPRFCSEKVVVKGKRE